MIARTGHVLYFVALAVWVGGMVALGAVVAPQLFRALPPAQAGDLFGSMLRIFSFVELGCGAVALAGACMTFAATRRAGFVSWIRIVVLSAMLLVTVGAAFAVNPKIRRLRNDPAEPARREFERAHKTSERMFLFNLVTGVALIGSSAWLQSRD